MWRVSAAGVQRGCLGALGALGCSWQPVRCLFSSFSLPVSAGRLREAELFAPGVPAEAGQGSPCPALELAQEAVMLLGWLGPGSWGATAPNASISPLETRVNPGFPSSQLCRSHISQCCRLCGDTAQGCVTEVTKEGDSTLAGCPKSLEGPLGVSLGGVPVPRECWLGAELWPWAGAAWPLGARFGSGGAACDAVALTSILCSAQGIKGQPGLCGEAAQRLLLGQNMKGFCFPCPLWLLASLLAAAREPWGCAEQDVAPADHCRVLVGCGCCCCSSGHSQSGL